MALGSGRSALDHTTNMITASRRRSAVGGTPQRQTITGMTTTGSTAALILPGIGARHGNLGSRRTATAKRYGRTALNSTTSPFTATPISAVGYTLQFPTSGVKRGTSLATSLIRGRIADIIEEHCHRLRCLTLHAFQVRVRARPEQAN